MIKTDTIPHLIGLSLWEEGSGSIQVKSLFVQHEKHHDEVLWDSYSNTGKTS
jgi:hypothetical protein